MAKPAALAVTTPASDGGDKQPAAKKKGFSLLNKTKASVVSRNLIPFSRRKVAKPISDMMSMTVQAPPPIHSVSFASGGSPESKNQRQQQMKNHPGKAAAGEDSDTSHSHGNHSNSNIDNNGNISDDTKISSLTDSAKAKASASRASDIAALSSAFAATSPTL